MLHKKAIKLAVLFKNKIGLSLATGAALFVGITQIWLLNNQNQLIHQQNKYIELQGFSGRAQAIQSILEGYSQTSNAALTIAQLESLGSEGFAVLLSLSASESSLKKFSIESLVRSRIADSFSKRAKVYIAIAKSYVENAKYNDRKDAGDAYYYLSLLDEYLKKTELKKGEIQYLSPELKREVRIITREVAIAAVHFRIMPKEDMEKYAKDIEKSESWSHDIFSGNEDDLNVALLLYDQTLVSVMSRFDSWCLLPENKFLPDILVENYRKSYKQRVDYSRKDVIVTHKDPWLFDTICKEINLFGYHKDIVELTRELSGKTIYLDENPYLTNQSTSRLRRRTR